MVRVWTHFENNTWRLALADDTDWRNNSRVHMKIRHNSLGLARILTGLYRPRAARNPISKALGGVSCSENSSASSNTTSQMGEHSTSDNDQEIHESPVSGPKNPDDGTRDDPALYSGVSSCSQSSPVEDHPASRTCEVSPDGANVSNILRVTCVRNLPPLITPLPARCYNLACLMNPVENVPKEMGEHSGEAAGMNIDVQVSPPYHVPSTPETPFVPDLETPLDPFPLGTHPSSSESPKESHHQESSASPI